MKFPVQTVGAVNARVFLRRPRPPLRHRVATCKRSFGFSLVETLIAIVVLSFGLLGVAGMQMAALQANREARMQSVAVSFATELAELMRSNGAAAAPGSGNPYFGDFSSPLQYGQKSYCLSIRVIGGCATAIDVAHAQMSDWLARIDLELPGARVQVCKDAEPYDSAGLPQWRCVEGAGAMTVVKIGWVQSSIERWRGGAFVYDQAARPSLVLPFRAGLNT